MKNDLLNLDDSPRTTRREHDNYSTPREVVRAGYTWFQSCVPGFKPTKILEPGCGDTAPFLTEAPWKDAQRVGCDIRRTRPVLTSPAGVLEGALFCTDHNFLTIAPAHKVLEAANLIATNPPFARAEDFMLRSLDLLAPYGYCLFLLRLSFLASQKRYKLWTERVQLLYVGVLSTRPSFTDDGLTDSVDYIWVVFQKRRPPSRGFASPGDVEPLLKSPAMLSWLPPLEK